MNGIATTTARGLLLGAALALGLPAQAARTPKTPPAPEPPGWVMVGVNVRALVGPKMEKVGEREGFYSFAIRNLTKGRAKTYNSGQLDKAFHLFEVEPGEYCFYEVRTYQNQDLPLCKDKSAPRFQVRSGEVLNLGYWVFGVNYDASGGGITYQRLEAFAAQRQLARDVAEGFDPRVVARVRAAHPPVSIENLAGSVWYALDPDGNMELVVLEPDGTLISQTMEMNHDAVPSRWSVVGDRVRMEINGGYAVIDVALKGGRLEGEFSNKAGFWSKWIAVRDPFEEVRYGDGVTPEVIWRRQLNWPKDVPNDGTPGSVTVSFEIDVPFVGRKGSRPAALVRDAKVVRSDPPGLYDAVALKIVNDRRYAPMRGPDGAPIRKMMEETITFPLPAK